MNTDQRIAAVGRWIERARDIEDPVDRFLTAWVALTIAAKRASVSRQAKKRVRDYLRLHKHAVREILDHHRFGELKLVGKLDPPPLSDPPTRLELIARASWDVVHGPNTPTRRLERMADLLVLTENELLLGVESPDDAARLRYLTPFLLDLLAACELRRGA